MATCKSIYENFSKFIAIYMKEHGQQSILQIKELTKQYAIDNRAVVYVMTTKKLHRILFLTFCSENNLEIPNDLGRY